MSKYPQGSHAESVIDFQRERISAMSERISLLEKQNEMLIRTIKNLNPNKSNEKDYTLRQIEARVSGIDYENSKRYPKGTQRVVDTLKSKTEATQLTIEEALDLGAFSYESKSTLNLWKKTQHAVYAFTEQYFNQE